MSGDFLAASTTGPDLYIHAPGGQSVTFRNLDPGYAARVAVAINRVPAPPTDPDFVAADDEVRVIAVCIGALMGLSTPVARNRVADYLVNRCAGMA
jgi:hypothetical protein